MIPTDWFSLHVSVPVFQNLFQYGKFLKRSRTPEKYFQITLLNGQCIKKILDKLCVPKQIVPTFPKREFLGVLPYSRKFSLNLRKRLFKSVSKSLQQLNIKVIQAAFLNSGT